METVCKSLILASLFLVLGFHILLFFPLAKGSDSGWEIDLFCQYGGVGKNEPSSPLFYVGDRIELSARVTYNQEPVQCVLVAIQVNNPQGFPLIVTTAQTNALGYATTNFTITENVYPVFPSLWESIATTSPTQPTVNDTMQILILPRPVPFHPPPPIPSVGGISSLVPGSAVHTYTRAVFVEILIASVAMIVFAKFRKLFKYPPKIVSMSCRKKRVFVQEQNVSSQ